VILRQQSRNASNNRIRCLAGFTVKRMGFPFDTSFAYGTNGDLLERFLGLTAFFDFD
jgi:hypothetical protein